MEEARQQPLPVEHRDKFIRAVVGVFLRSAFFPWCHLTRETRKTTSALHQQSFYRLNLEGLDDIANCDVFFANHQGPSGEGTKQGGLEVLFGTQFVPDKTRYVLRETLIHYRWPPKQCIKAHAMRRPQPIAVREQDRVQKLRGCGSWQAIKQAAVSLKKERQRVAQEIFRVIDRGRPVMIYPEGTRSASGTILPFVSDFMRHTITDYILPRMRRGQPRHIGLIVGETLRAFPDGIGCMSRMCDRPITMRGLLYDTRAIEAECGQLDQLRDRAYEVELTRLARVLAWDMRASFARELRDILGS